MTSDYLFQATHKNVTCGRKVQVLTENDTHVTYKRELPIVFLTEGANADESRVNGDSINLVDTMEVPKRVFNMQYEPIKK